MTFRFSESWTPNGIQTLTGDDLLLLVSDAPFSPTAETADDIAGTEVGPRVECVGAPNREESGWDLGLDDLGTSTLTGTAVSYYLVTDGATDADRLIVGGDDTVIPAGLWEPSFDDGAIFLPFKPRPGLYSELNDVDATGDSAPEDGQVPVWVEADGKWRPGDQSGGGGGGAVETVATVAPVSGDVPAEDLADELRDFLGLKENLSDLDDVDVATRTSGQVLTYDGSLWKAEDPASGGAVDSVNGQTGVVVLDADDIADGTTNKAFTATEQTKLAAITGTNTGDQTITLTGDVTGSGTGSFATAIGAGVIVDADVNASAAIAPSKISGTAVVQSRTLAGLDLSADRSASALRTALSLVIGTDVQAYDADLGAIAALTSAADRVPYFTGSGTAALATFTASGRTLTGQASLAAALAQLSGQAAADFDFGANKVTGSAFVPGGLTGSVAASRFVGATTSGAPTTGAHVVGDVVTTQDGDIFICTTAGTPGTWTRAGYPGDALWVPAAEFFTYEGTPTVGLVNSTTLGIQLDDASSESSVAVTQVPSHWVTMALDFVGAKIGAGNGNVVPRYQVENIADTSALAAGSMANGTTLTASTVQYQVKVSQVATSIAVSSGQFQRICLGRSGGAGADTLTGDYALLGVRLRRVT